MVLKNGWHPQDPTAYRLKLREEGNFGLKKETRSVKPWHGGWGCNYNMQM